MLMEHVARFSAEHEDSFDFGEGAAFYLNATQPGWEKFRMYEYITAELPQVLQQFPELDVEKVNSQISLLLKRMNFLLEILEVQGRYLVKKMRAQSCSSCQNPKAIGFLNRQQYPSDKFSSAVSIQI